jgi:hypothetical protein
MRCAASPKLRYQSTRSNITKDFILQLLNSKPYNKNYLWNQFFLLVYLWCVALSVRMNLCYHLLTFHCIPPRGLSAEHSKYKIFTTNFTVPEFVIRNDIFATYYCCTANKIHSRLYVTSFIWVARFVLHVRKSNYAAQTGLVFLSIFLTQMWKLCDAKGSTFSRNVMVYIVVLWLWSGLWSRYIIPLTPTSQFLNLQLRLLHKSSICVI